MRFSVGGTASFTGLDSQVHRLTGPPFDGSMVGRAIRLESSNVFHNVVTISSADVMLVTPNPAPAAAESTWTVDSGAALDGVTGGFLDGYFIVNRVPRLISRQRIRIRGGSSTSARCMTARSGIRSTSASKKRYADYINSILCDHEELILFGRETIEVWTNIGSTLDNSGVASFPFQRQRGRVHSRWLGSGLRALLGGAVHLLARRHPERSDGRATARSHSRRNASAPTRRSRRGMPPISKCLTQCLTRTATADICSGGQFLAAGAARRLLGL